MTETETLSPLQLLQGVLHYVEIETLLSEADPEATAYPQLLAVVGQDAQARELMLQVVVQEDIAQAAQAELQASADLAVAAQQSLTLQFMLRLPFALPADSPLDWPRLLLLLNRFTLLGQFGWGPEDGFFVRYCLLQSREYPEDEARTWVEVVEQLLFGAQRLAPLLEGYLNQAFSLAEIEQQLQDQSALEAGVQA